MRQIRPKMTLYFGHLALGILGFRHIFKRKTFCQGIVFFEVCLGRWLTERLAGGLNFLNFLLPDCIKLCQLKRGLFLDEKLFDLGII